MDASATRLRAALADRYAVKREIGSGGMATVYLAEDLRHHRKVALKVLKPELAAAIGPDRFLREIEIAAGLSHPHILPVHDSGEADGLLYFVMPFVDGESLRKRLDREGVLPIDDAVRIACEIAGALESAHRHGVIHRDIKPENILFQEGHAVVADFGIAKAAVETGHERLTQTGVSVGTPQYMSPEQATGAVTDARSDIYSLGAVLYEMLTGEPPHTGATSGVVVAKLLTERPIQPLVVRETIPEPLDHAVMKALAKTPEDRFATAGELADALTGAASVSLDGAPLGLETPSRVSHPRAWIALATVVVGLTLVLVALTTLIPRDSAVDGPLGTVSESGTLGASGLDVRDERVAVLPPDNHTGDPSLDRIANWAADYITEGLVRAELTQVVPFPEVVVSERMASGEGTELGLAQTWPRVTGATLALAGGLYLRRDSIQFRMRIVNPDGVVLATVEPVDGPLADPEEALGALQVRAVSAYAGLVAPGHDRNVWALSHRPPDPEAVEVLLEGWTIGVREGWGRAMPYIERAHELDPEYPAPLFLLTNRLFFSGRYVEADSLCRAMEPKLGEWSRLDRLQAERICAFVAGDNRSAVEASRLITDRTPRGTTTLCTDYLIVNRPREAAEACSRYEGINLGAIAREYLDTNAALWANALHLIGEYVSELEVVLDAREDFPEHFVLIQSHARALVALGRLDEASSLIEGEIARLGSDVVYEVFPRLAQEYDVHGYSDAADQLWEGYLEWYESNQDQVGRQQYLLNTLHALTNMGRFEDAEPVVEALVREFPDRFQNLGRLGVVRAALGQRAEAEAIAERLRLLDAPFPRGGRTFWRAHIYAHLREPDQAVALLKQAMEEGWGVSDNLHRSFGILHGHPAFEELRTPG